MLTSWCLKGITPSSVYLTPEQLARQKIVRTHRCFFSGKIFLYISPLTWYTAKLLRSIVTTFYWCTKPLKCCCCCSKLHLRGCRETKSKSCPNLPKTTDSHWHSFCTFSAQGEVNFPTTILKCIITALDRKPCIISRTELFANCKASPLLTIIYQFSKDPVFMSALHCEIAVFKRIHLWEHFWKAHFLVMENTCLV